MNEIKDSLELNPENDKINYMLGGIVAVLGAILGIIVAPLLFLKYYIFLAEAEAEICPVGCENIIKWFLPGYTDVAVIAGFLYLIAAYGFFTKQHWAFKVTIIANILALKSSFWPIIPFLDTHNAPVYMILFMPNLIFYIVNTWLVGKIQWGRILVSLVLGMSMITGFMSGTSATNMFMKTTWMIENGTTIPTPLNNFTAAPLSAAKIAQLQEDIALYMFVQRIGWITGILIGIVCFAVLFFPKEKVRLMGIAAGLPVLLYEIPLAARITEIKGEFSMMYYAPILVAMYMIVFLVPSFWKKVVDPVDVE